ncbi:acyltransferase family protein [Prosthecobacter sp.]|uniref:acyltransferase family protein n=1 Tax=Prosthecobacter sp. TaxID=1965333 RepID=UPI0037846D17
MSESSSRGKIQALEGLRGYLAMWVVVTHLFQFSGHPLLGLPVISLLTSGHHAVNLFMILSGFVIALLVHQRPESYGSYVRRRFFRIYPVLFFGVLLGIIVHPMRGELLTTWWPAFFDQDLLSYFNKCWQAFDSNIIAYAACDFTMTNGVVPNSVLPYVSVAFNGVAWSLSLEFQFYLIAPLLCYLLQPLRRHLVKVCLGVFAVMLFRSFIFPPSNGLPWSTHGAFLPFNIEWFLLGILSYHLRSYCLEARLQDFIKVPLLPVALVLSLLLARGHAVKLLGIGFEEVIGDALPLVVWTFVLCYMIDSDAGNTGLLNKLARRTLESPLALFVGSISYSIYLLHNPVIIFVEWAAVRHFGIHTWQSCFLATGAISLPLVLGLATLSYRYIELPFMRAIKKAPRPALTAA